MADMDACPVSWRAGDVQDMSDGSAPLDRIVLCGVIATGSAGHRLILGPQTPGASNLHHVAAHDLHGVVRCSSTPLRSSTFTLRILPAADLFHPRSTLGFVVNTTAGAVAVPNLAWLLLGR